MRKRDLLILALALTVAIAGAAWVFSTDALAAGSWGLSFRQEGAPPLGNAAQDQLRKYDAVYLGDTSQKVLYLTFDAGYENGATEEILDILKKHDAKAAFFLVGSYMDRNADLVRRMAAEGHTVANHTMHHPDMSKLTQKEVFQQELTDLETKYQDLTGQPLAKFYRPPQGLYSEENLKQAQELGYKTIFWSLAHVDWHNDSQPDPRKATEKLLSRTHPGAIVLLHATSKTNAAILDDLLTQWKANGYTIATLDTIFQ